METEKICCVPYSNGNDLATAALLRDNNSPLEAMALMKGNSWQDNPFVYLVWMMFAQNMWGNNRNGVQDAEIQSRLNNLQNQLSDNHNTDLLMDAIKGNEFALSQLAQNLNVNFNTLSQCCCDIKSAIREVGGQVGFSAERVINAANLGDCRIIEALKDCCCATQRQIADFRADVQLQTCQQTGELRNGQKDIIASITSGFSATAFQAQQDKCDIIRASENNTQRIIDTLNSHWRDELALKNQDLKFELSQERQTRMLLDRGFGCDNGCR